jgi:hypothetical protein
MILGAQSGAAVLILDQDLGGDSIDCSAPLSLLIAWCEGQSAPRWPPCRCRAGGRPEAARRAGLEGVEKSLPAPSTAWTRRSGTLACFAPTPSYRWSSRLLALAPCRPGHGRRRPPQAWPSSSATTSTVDRALPSPVVRQRRRRQKGPQVRPLSHRSTVAGQCRQLVPAHCRWWLALHRSD